MQEFKQKTAVVTGAASGIGLELAKVFAEQGAGKRFSAFELHFLVREGFNLQALLVYLRFDETTAFTERFLSLGYQSRAAPADDSRICTLSP